MGYAEHGSASSRPEANAIERGQHLVNARYACSECHGRDLSGGVMVDDPAMGCLLGPNLTTGAGGRAREYDDVPGPTLGPVGTILIALGELPLSAATIRDHQAAHAVEPPTPEPTPEFGRHLIAVCTGCHRVDLSGGPILAGPPDWLPAANLTSHVDGIGSWDYNDFVGAMRRGVRPDGSALRAHMLQLRRYAEAMTEVELQALWAYLQSVEARPTGR